MRASGKSGLLVLLVFLLYACTYYGTSGVRDHYSKNVAYASAGRFIDARKEFKKNLKRGVCVTPQETVWKSLIMPSF